MQNNLLQTFSKNRKLILAAFLPLSFWIGVFAFWFYGTGTSSAGPIVLKSPQNKIDNSISQIASIGTTQTDGDNDGLSDWEESIYGTNPSNPDSDDDGYLDGEEIISSRDPLKKGPNDLIAKTANISEENKTATDKFVKLAMDSFLKSSQNQNFSDINAEQLNQFVAQSFNSEKASEEFKDILKSELYYFIPPNIEKEIKLAKGDSKDAQDKYWLEIANFLLLLKNNNPPYDFAQTISESMQTKNYAKLDILTNYHKDYYEKSKNINVPPSLINNHRDLITFLYKYWKIGEAIKIYDRDPIKSLLALNELTKIIQDTKKAFTK